jgi:hypothetical protein
MMILAILPQKKCIGGFSILSAVLDAVCRQRLGLLLQYRVANLLDGCCVPTDILPA